MWLRLFIVLFLFVLAAAILVNYSDAVLGWVQHYWGLDEAGRKQWKDAADLIQKGLIIFGMIFGGIMFLWKFVFKPKSDTSGNSSAKGATGNAATFHNKVKIKGDFVQGNKGKE